MKAIAILIILTYSLNSIAQSGLQKDRTKLKTKSLQYSDFKKEKCFIVRDKIRCSNDSTSTQYWYNGPLYMNSPQIFLNLSTDSIFQWDAFYGNDAFLASGRYTIIKDELILDSDSVNTKKFEAVYRECNPKWKWYQLTKMNDTFYLRNDRIYFEKN
jgi:hypothetical protein